MKKHRRAKHPRPAVARATVPPIPIPDVSDLAAAIREVESPARATQVDELADELLAYLDHVHADLRAIREHLGIPWTECKAVAPEYEDEPQ
jgi:hypothetical protein